MNWLGKLATEAENFLEQTENVGQNVAEKINNSNESVESIEPTQSNFLKAVNSTSAKL
jgi:hypothetical protein